MARLTRIRPSLVSLPPFFAQVLVRKTRFVTMVFAPFDVWPADLELMVAVGTDIQLIAVAERVLDNYISAATPGASSGFLGASHLNATFHAVGELLNSVLEFLWFSEGDVTSAANGKSCRPIDMRFNTA
jgi:hypothetical protein